MDKCERPLYEKHTRLLALSSLPRCSEEDSSSVPTGIKDREVRYSSSQNEDIFRPNLLMKQLIQPLAI